jgi:hypothetical protein
MKFGAHQTFHLREGWLLKGLNALHTDPKVFSSEDATTTLGVGKNMVESIDYWLRALRLIEKKTTGVELTSLAKMIKDNDPYLECDGTVVLCHYLLATNEAEATTWYWFFNKFAATEFEADSLKVYLQSYVQSLTDKANNQNTLERDVTCLLRTYMEPTYADKDNPETINPSPFSKFGLISSVDKKLKKNKFKLADVNPLVFVYLAYHFWKEELGSPKSIQLEELITKDKSPGMVLGFSLDDTLSMIESIERQYGDKYLQFSRTGGYMIITLSEKDVKNAMKDYYKALSMGIK